MGHDGREYHLGPRIPVFNVETPIEYVAEEPRGLLGASRVMGMPPSRVIAARADSATCTAGSADLCEKPTSSTTMTLPIVLGVAIPIVGALGLLIYLHRRNVKRQRQEDARDPHKSLDFGLDEGGKKRKSGFLMGSKNEKDPKHRNQLSMDMDMSSPYLLPPGLQNSRESIHSLARSFKKDEDPYGPINEYAQSDVASLRSQRPGPQRKNTDGMSIYTTGSSGMDSAKTGRFVQPPPRQNSLPPSVYSVPSSPLANNPYSHGNPFDSDNALPDTNVSVPAPPAAALQHHQSLHAEVETITPEVQTTPYPGEAAGAPGTTSMPDAGLIQEPPPAAVKNSPFPRSPSRANRDEDELHMSMTSDPNTSLYIEDDDPSYLAAIVQEKEPAPQRQSPQVLGLLDPPINANGTGESVSQSPGFDFQTDFDMGNPFSGEETYPARGRQLHRNSTMNEDGGLGVPQHDTKRLSVGYRPLPPSEIMETEDPERRADRIRSFYKEYFDESKRESVVPPLPDKAPARIQQHRSQKAEYYEDYDGDYLGETFFDPESKAFVMPYAEPVTRRAMTPPPRGRVPGGPGPGPRPHAGSMSGMRGPPGMRGPHPGVRPRAGSVMSGRYHGPPSIPGSVPGSRAGSRAGSRPGSRARKPMPPPSALNTLPNPSKLKDDSFALLSSIEFAPPESFADRAAGRSQSPAGERKPYQLKVPVSSPLISSYDEMAALPSPHLLRKSGTFTGLDFAPPKRFKDPETMSDAGSIRSNQSGISAMHNAALRSGAGRVSRLPGDMVFSQADMTNQLKPQWGMRP